MFTNIRLGRMAVVFLALVPVLFGSVVTSDPGLPPSSGGYLTAAEVHALYPAGIYPEIILKNILHSRFFGNHTDPCGSGPGGACLQETFGSFASGNASVAGGPFFPVNLSGETVVRTYGYNTGGSFFDTEMLQLNLSGGGGLLIRESPTKQSLGQTRIVDLGGGLFEITSFFDIFTELSPNGGIDWVESDGSTHVELQELPSGIPEPATVLLLGSALTALGLLRRRS